MWKIVHKLLWTVLSISTCTTTSSSFPFVYHYSFSLTRSFVLAFPCWSCCYCCDSSWRREEEKRRKQSVWPTLATRLHRLQIVSLPVLDQLYRDIWGTTVVTRNERNKRTDNRIRLMSPAIHPHSSVWSLTLTHLLTHKTNTHLIVRRDKLLTTTPPSPPPQMQSLHPSHPSLALKLICCCYSLCCYFPLHPVPHTNGCMTMSFIEVQSFLFLCFLFFFFFAQNSIDYRYILFEGRTAGDVLVNWKGIPGGKWKFPDGRESERPGHSWFAADRSNMIIIMMMFNRVLGISFSLFLSFEPHLWWSSRTRISACLPDSLTPGGRRLLPRSTYFAASGFKRACACLFESQVQAYVCALRIYRDKSSLSMWGICDISVCHETSLVKSLTIRQVTGGCIGREISVRMVDPKRFRQITHDDYQSYMLIMMFVWSCCVSWIWVSEVREREDMEKGNQNQPEIHEQR